MRKRCRRCRGAARRVARARARVRVGLRGASLHHAPRDRSAAAGAEAVLRAHRDEVVVRVNDPDLWRNVGWEDDPNHFVDFGVPELRPVSVHRAAARVRRRAREVRHATLRRTACCRGARPRVRQPAARLRRVHPRRPTRRATSCCSRASPSHYMQDAHQPLHATEQLRRPADRQQRHPLALRTRSVRAVRVASRDSTGAARRRWPTRATPRSTRCSPAISSSMPI